MKTIFNIFSLCLTLSLLTFVALSCCDDDTPEEEAMQKPKPIVTSFTPTEGIPSTTKVTIIGENFSNNIDEVRVWINGIEAEAIITNVTTTQIDIILPENASTGLITVEVNGQFGSSTEPFNVLLLPEVSFYSVPKGEVGDTIIITGKNFSNILENNIVKFNGVEAMVSTSSATTLDVVIPEGATTGNITVTVNDATATGAIFNIVVIPVIEAVTPNVAPEGTPITITGKKFSPILEENLVWFNNTPAVVTAATETTITTSVPVGATSGPIKVEVNGESAETTEDFVIAQLLSVKLTDNDDDAEEVAVSFGDPVGTMDTGSSDLEFGEISSGQGLMNVGLRYNNVNLPQGANILEAYIQFNVKTGGANPVELTIYGENTANAAAYTETLGDLSARALTSANVVWSIPEWENKGDRGDAQKTVNIASIIQEIVNRADWVPGNSINIIFKHSGVSLGASSSSGGREAQNYSSSKPDDGAELSVFYN